MNNQLYKLNHLFWRKISILLGPPQFFEINLIRGNLQDNTDKKWYFKGIFRQKLHISIKLTLLYAKSISACSNQGSVMCLVSILN